MTSKTIEYVTEKSFEFLFKLAFITGCIWLICWIIATINTWTQCLVSMTNSLKIIAEKLS